MTPIYASLFSRYKQLGVEIIEEQFTMTETTGPLVQGLLVAKTMHGMLDALQAESDPEQSTPFQGVKRARLVN